MVQQVEVVVLDTSPIVSQKLSHTIARRFVTTSSVLDEVKSDVRNTLSSLPFVIEVREPSRECIKAARSAASKTGDIASLSQTDLIVIALAIQESNEAQTEPISAEADPEEDGWITPGNIKAHVDLSSTVACMSNDFAVQNVLSHLGITVLSLDGVKITCKKSFVLRCYGCFKTTREMEKKFCPSCGGATLTKVSAQISSAGDVKVFLKKNYQYNLRGTIYPIPETKVGKNASNLILREDQKEALKLQSRRRPKKEEDAFDQDYIPSMMKNLSLKQRERTESELTFGYGRKNPNEAKRKV